MVQVTLTGAQEDVIDIGLYLLFERTVALHTKFQVRTIVAHHIDDASRQFVTVFLINPSLHRLQHLGTLE